MVLIDRKSFRIRKIFRFLDVPCPLTPFEDDYISRASNIAFLLDWAQMSDLDFGLIQQNISIKKASFQY